MLEQAQQAVFQVRADRGRRVMGTGTGFVINDEGFVVTNFHVVQGATAAQAVFDGRAPRRSRSRGGKAG